MTKDKKYQTFRIANQSLYFLYHLDSLGVIITTMKFGRKNYDLWEKVVIIPLRTKNKLGFINESITKPQDKKGEYSEEAKAWEMANSMVMS